MNIIKRLIEYYKSDEYKKNKAISLKINSSIRDSSSFHYTFYF
ncbi:MAG: hypothetical protein PQJ49_07010 [Sphaerochaetaceae bacterium]|nr:hypothetical protein [Sphaerochaetaceae bacterium]MDC7238134.1 hypothetical protein [Sphaerochaetaceae bacterium]MDC7249647.1 hypothetical protein [Sphaerochaetaceae bacterium]